MADRTPKGVDWAAMPPKTAELIREAGIRITTRRDKRLYARRDWLRDGFDIASIRDAAPHGTFALLIRELTPYTADYATDLARAAGMLAEACKSRIIREIPDRPSTVCLELAKRKTPQHVRDRFLPLVLAGERIKVSEIKAASRPPAVVLEEDAETAPTLPVVPSKRIADVVDHLPEDEGRAILALISEGETEALRIALDWRFSAPAVPHARRIREHARAAIAETPQLDLLAPDVPVLTEADETEADTEKPRLH